MFLASNNKDSNSMNSSQIPFASVIFLTRNGGLRFQESLRAVLCQETNFPFEIIVVDSGSTDNIHEFLREQPVKFFSIASEDFNFGATRDLGFSLGSGKILVTLSQDAKPATKYWLKYLCEPFNNPDVAVVQGEETPWPNKKIFFWNKIRVSHLSRISRRWAKLYDGLGLSFVNCAIRRSIWETNRIGRVEMSEDKVFQKMLANQRYRIVKTRNAKVWHSHDYDLKSLAKRCKNEGLGWKNVGMDYSRADMIWDMFHPIILMVLVLGLITLQISSLAELLFPWIRPFCIYEGNHSNNSYIP